MQNKIFPKIITLFLLTGSLVSCNGSEEEVDYSLHKISITVSGTIVKYNSETFFSDLRKLSEKTKSEIVSLTTHAAPSTTPAEQPTETLSLQNAPTPAEQILAQNIDTPATDRSDELLPTGEEVNPAEVESGEKKVATLRALDILLDDALKDQSSEAAFSVKEKDQYVAHLNSLILDQVNDEDIFWTLSSKLDGSDVAQLYDQKPKFCLRMDVAVTDSKGAIKPTKIEYCTPSGRPERVIIETDYKDIPTDSVWPNRLKLAQNFSAKVDLNFKIIYDLLVEKGIIVNPFDDIGTIGITPYLQFGDRIVEANQEQIFVVLDTNDDKANTKHQLLKRYDSVSGPAEGSEITNQCFSIGMTY